MNSQQEEEEPHLGEPQERQRRQAEHQRDPLLQGTNPWDVYHKTDLSQQPETNPNGSTSQTHKLRQNLLQNFRIEEIPLKRIGAKKTSLLTIGKCRSKLEKVIPT